MLAMTAEITIVIMIMIEVNQEVTETVEEELLVVVVEDPPQMKMPTVFNRLWCLLRHF